MSDRLFVLVVEGDIFFRIYIPGDHPIAKRYYEGLSSNPYFINCTGKTVRIGDTFDGNNFYSILDKENNSPIEITDENAHKEYVQHACVSNGYVFGKITTSISDPDYNMILAGMMSNPICVESTDNPFADVGWTWDSQYFYPPGSRS